LSLRCSDRQVGDREFVWLRSNRMKSGSSDRNRSSRQDIREAASVLWQVPEGQITSQRG